MNLQLLIWKRPNCQACQQIDALTQKLMQAFPRHVEERIVGITYTPEQANNQFGIFEVPTVQFWDSSNGQILQVFPFEELLKERAAANIIIEFQKELDLLEVDPPSNNQEDPEETIPRKSNLWRNIGIGFGIFAIGKIISSYNGSTEN